jgi:hypothetical protein
MRVEIRGAFVAGLFALAAATGAMAQEPIGVVEGVRVILNPDGTYDVQQAPDGLLLEDGRRVTLGDEGWRVVSEGNPLPDTAAGATEAASAGGDASAAGGEAVIARYSGSGAQSPRPFTVDGPWELQWEADGALFTVHLKDASGKLIDVMANSAPAAPGAAYRAQGGTYALDISALGSWTVRVVAVE